jgi:hypothetical protein
MNGEGDSEVIFSCDIWIKFMYTCLCNTVQSSCACSQDHYSNGSFSWSHQGHEGSSENFFSVLILEGLFRRNVGCH